MLRAAWHKRASIGVIAWLAIAAVIALTGLNTEHPGWLVTHALLLGAVTNAIIVWAWHFTTAIMFLPHRDGRKTEWRRLLVLNIGIVGVLVGEYFEQPIFIAAGAVLVMAAVLWLLVSIWQAARKALPNRFAMTVQGYASATFLLFAGLVLGLWLAIGDFNEPLERRLMLAHLTLNVLGWVGLTILATLVTLWPTMLRIQLVDGTESKARQALPLLNGGVVIAALGFGIGNQLVTLLGLLSYLLGYGLTALPMLQSLHIRRPSNFATWSALLGTLWGGMSLLVLLALVSAEPGAAKLLQRGAGLLAATALGAILQILLGALAYLLPVMAGGGPAAMRHRIALTDRLTTPRIILHNAGAVICALDYSSTFTRAGLGIVAISTAVTLALIVLGIGKVPPGAGVIEDGSHGI